MANSEQLDLRFDAVVQARGDGSYVVRPGKPRMAGRLTVAEVARELAVTQQHVLDLIDEGQLEAINVGGGTRRHWRVTAEALRRFCDSRSSLR